MRMEFDREVDGRWIADVIDVPGALAYGATKDEAARRAWGIALITLGDRMGHGEMELLTELRLELP